MTLRERLHELIEELPDEDLAGVEPVLKELALRRRMLLRSVMQQVEEDSRGRSAIERPEAGDGRGGNYTGWDELWADFHWGRRR